MKKHFNEFKEEKLGMSNVSLSHTLKYLENQGIIVKNVFEDDSKQSQNIFSQIPV